MHEHRIQDRDSPSLTCSGLGIVIFFVTAVKQSIFNPHVTLSGMIIGNMTGVNLATKTFCESLSEKRQQMESLLNLGVTPQKILLPMVNQALETAMLPTPTNAGDGHSPLPE